MPRSITLIFILCFPQLLLGNTPTLKDQVHRAPASKTQLLGEALFFDASLSQPPGQSCASCHDPRFAFTDPDKDQTLSEGANKGRFVTRNTPTAMYTRFTPPLHFDNNEGLWIGGQLLDGRKNTLEEQAKLPFLGFAEMANIDGQSVVNKVRKAPYAPLVKALYGEDIFNDSAAAFDAIASAISAFERTSQFNPFSSKYDLYLAGAATLSKQEQLGLKLFEAEDKGNCAACHPSRPDKNGQMPLFTDYSYDNLGLPANPLVPTVDLGLGVTVKDPAENGKFRVPTLRNVALTSPYTHNGSFSTLKELLEFYNTRDTDSRWGKAEVPATMNTQELGDLKLEDEEIDALVAFLKALTDGYQENRHSPSKSP